MDSVAVLCVRALVVVVVIVVIAFYLFGGAREWGGAQSMVSRPRAAPGAGPFPDLAHGYPYSYVAASASPAAFAQNVMYSTAEVDPLVTGQLYAGARSAGTERRFLYGGRTSHGHKWGLREFSTGVPGQAGVDVGLLGMREYSLDGLPGVYDDGIPENWQLPSTPVNWYVPQGRDYYDVEAQGPGVYKPNLMSLQEPDHDPLLN